jgi:type VI secretion system ImpC/EvpB family protein
LSRDLSERDNPDSLSATDGDNQSVLTWALEKLSQSGQGRPDDVESTLAHLIDLVQRELTQRINQVLRSPKFQRLEATYRNLKWLVDLVSLVEPVLNRSDDPPFSIGLYVLNISADELNADLQGYAHVKSTLYTKLYTQRFDMLVARPTPGVDLVTNIYPFSMMIMDFDAVIQSPQDHELSLASLEQLSLIGRDCFCMFLVSASPKIFGIKDYSEFPAIADLKAWFSNNRHTREWNNFRKLNSSRMVGVTLPRVLVRPPYRHCFLPGAAMSFSEDRGASKEQWLWGSSVFAVARVFIRSFREYGWFADSMGIDRIDRTIPAYLSTTSGGAQSSDVSGGMIDLAIATRFETERVGSADFPAVECVINEADEAVLSSLGFIAIFSCPRTNFGALLSCQTAQDIQRMTDIRATNNLRLSTMFNYMLCACRMALLLKNRCQQMVGRSIEGKDIEDILNKILISYSSHRQSTIPQKRAKPFCSPGTDVTVTADELDPGKYRCSISLCPHHQFDSVDSKLIFDPITLNMNIKSSG